MRKFAYLLCAAMLLGMLAGCQTEPANTQPAVSTAPTGTLDIRPLPPENPGSSLIEYDPDRQVYIASENIYIDYYAGISLMPNIIINIYSKEYIDPAEISVAIPVDLPFEVLIASDEVIRQTEFMVHETERWLAMPYYVYYAYRGEDPERLDANIGIGREFQTLKSEDLPEFYSYTINVALINILELAEPVTLEKVDITLGDQTYEAKFGRVRLFPEEDFPSDAQEIIGRAEYGSFYNLYNDGVVRFTFDFYLEKVPEDITITGLRMLEEESEILDIYVGVTSGGMWAESKWDGKEPIYLYKGDSVYWEVFVKNELTEKLLNKVLLQAVLEYTKDESGEKGCLMTTFITTGDISPYEAYAIIFDGVDMEPYYREYYYKYNDLLTKKYREKEGQ